jgi:hypothetical protein
MLNYQRLSPAHTTGAPYARTRRTLACSSNASVTESQRCCLRNRQRKSLDAVDTLWLCQNSYWKWPFIVSFAINSMVIFHSYVSLPEGTWDKTQLNLNFQPSWFGTSKKNNNKCAYNSWLHQEKKLGSPQPAQQYSVGFAFNWQSLTGLTVTHPCQSLANQKHKKNPNKPTKITNHLLVESLGTQKYQKSSKNIQSSPGLEIFTHIHLINMAPKIGGTSIHPLTIIKSLF